MSHAREGDDSERETTWARTRDDFTTTNHEAMNQNSGDKGFGRMNQKRRPSVVNVGAIFSFDSVIGRVAKATMEAAASAVNADRRILSGTELKLIMEDTNCSVFMGPIEVLKAERW